MTTDRHRFLVKASGVMAAAIGLFCRESQAVTSNRNSNGLFADK